MVHGSLLQTHVYWFEVSTAELHWPVFLLCCSLGEQMDQAAVVYLDLLEGTDKPVAGSTCEYAV